MFMKYFYGYRSGDFIQAMAFNHGWLRPQSKGCAASSFTRMSKGARRRLDIMEAPY